MGIMIDRAPEVFVNCVNEDSTLFYGGFYHLCARIVQGDDCLKKEDRALSLQQDCFVQLNDGYQVAFTEEVALMQEKCLEPVIQMEILANIPWVLKEACAY